MGATGWQKPWVRLVTTILTIGMMVMIFLFSTQTAERSDRTSGFFSNAIISILYPNYADEETDRQQEIYDGVQFIVRKCAHFLEYTLLGFLIRLCYESWIGHRVGKKKIMAAATCTGAAYAGSDELHQKLIDGRSGQISDVLLDSCGVFLGAALAWRIIRGSRRKRKEEQS